jgi:hypothetical protein
VNRQTYLKMCLDSEPRKIKLRERHNCWVQWMLASGNCFDNGHLSTTKKVWWICESESHSGKGERTFAVLAFFRHFHSMKKLGNNILLFPRKFWIFEVCQKYSITLEWEKLFLAKLTFFGKTIMPSLRQSLYLQGSTFDFYRTYFSQTLLIQGYLLTYHIRGV